MRLPDQIRAVACVAWVGTLGFGTYFACEADSYSRVGVIREGSAARTRLADLSAQDALSRPAKAAPRTGERLGANPASPGFALVASRSGETRGIRPSALKPKAMQLTQGDRLALPRSSESVALQRAGGGHLQVFEGGAAWKADTRPGWNSPLDPDHLRGIAAKEGETRRAGVAPGHHLRTLAPYQPYILTSYSHGCILPKFGPEPPPQPMANGEWPVAGLHVAADPSLAFGTVLEVVYQGLPSRLIVGDRGRAIRGRRLDLFLADCRAARDWGRRTAFVREISE